MFGEKYQEFVKKKQHENENNNNKNKFIKKNNVINGYMIRDTKVEDKLDPENRKAFADKTCEQLRNILMNNEANDVLAFTLNGDVNSKTYSNIEMVGVSDLFDITTFESLARVLGHAFATKLGLNAVIAEYGENADDWFIKIYAKLVAEFSKELIRTAIEDVTDNDNLKIRLANALGEVDPNNELLKNMSLVKTACANKASDDVIEKFAVKLYKDIRQIVGEDIDDGQSVIDLFM